MNSPPEEKKDFSYVVHRQQLNRYFEPLLRARLTGSKELEDKQKEIVDLLASIKELEKKYDEVEDLSRSAEIGDDAPPELAELLLTFCARASQDEFAAGDMREIFARDCAERGPSRAGRLYWSNVLGYLLQRSLRLAALVGFIRRLFVG
jgi:hypothetical protein